MKWRENKPFNANIALALPVFRYFLTGPVVNSLAKGGKCIDYTTNKTNGGIN